jgi:hypothetical protein
LLHFQYPARFDVAKVKAMTTSTSQSTLKEMTFRTRKIAQISGQE